MKKFKEMSNEEKLEKIKDALHKKKFELCEGSENGLGKGGFGAVFKVREENKKNNIYTAKLIFDDAKNKIEKVKEFRGKNIIKIVYEYFGEKEDFYMIVMELSSFGSLYQLIGKKGIKGHLTIEKKREFLKSLLTKNSGII